MSASVVRAFHDAMRSTDQAGIDATLSEDVVIVQPRALPYGGTTTSRAEFYERVFGYGNERATFRLRTSEVFGDGDRLAGHFTATWTGRGSGETFLLSQAELYEVTDGVITRVEVFQDDTAGLTEFFARNAPTA